MAILHFVINFGNIDGAENNGISLHKPIKYREFESGVLSTAHFERAITSETCEEDMHLCSSVESGWVTELVPGHEWHHHLDIRQFRLVAC